jgi:ankyrin repeat protein
MPDEAGDDWFTQTEKRKQRLLELYREFGQGGDSATVQARAEELRRLIEEEKDAPPPTPEDRAALRRHLEAKYGKRSRRRLVLLAVKDALLELRRISKEMRGSMPQELTLAVLRGDLSKVRKLVATGFDVNAVDSTGNSLLLDAILQRHDAIAEALRAAGARVGLLEACVMGDLEAARRLLDGGADSNMKNGRGVTALAFAASRGHLEVVRLLLARGADVNAATDKGFTSLMTAAQSDQPEIARELVAAGAHVGLVEAAMMGDVASVRESLEAGESIETRHKVGWTPLMAAAAAGQTEAAA